MSPVAYEASSDRGVLCCTWPGVRPPKARAAAFSRKRLGSGPNEGSIPCLHLASRRAGSAAPAMEPSSGWNETAATGSPSGQWSSDRLHVRQSLQRRQKLLDQDAEQIAAPKTARGVRVVPILPLLRPHLERHKRDHARPNQLDLAFPSDTGGPLDSSNVVNRVYLPSVKRAGLHRIRFHDLRHTFVTYCAAAGVPLAKVGDWVGHSDSRITEVYRHASADSEEFALARLAEFDRARCTNVAPTGNDRKRRATTSNRNGVVTRKWRG